MTGPTYLRAIACLSAAVVLTQTAGCEALRPKATPQPSLYALEGSAKELPPAATSAATVSLLGPALIVGPTHAAAGFDSTRIVYTREAHHLEYFANSEWVDTPARMLPPLIAAAVARGGVIRTIVLAPSAAGGDLRLETEVIRLQQEFASKPSRVRFTLRATLVDEATHQVVTTKEFESTVVAAADGPYAGVVAANSAVGSALEALAAFCNEAAGTWRRSRSNAAMPLEGSSLGR